MAAKTHHHGIAKGVLGCGAVAFCVHFLFSCQKCCDAFCDEVLFGDDEMHDYSPTSSAIMA